MKLLLLSILIGFLFGCAAHTPKNLEDCEDKACEERWEARLHTRQADKNNWYFCQRIYKELGVPTIHVDHRHDNDGKIKATENAAVFHRRDDLWRNGCKKLLGEAWEE